MASIISHQKPLKNQEKTKHEIEIKKVNLETFKSQWASHSKIVGMDTNNKKDKVTKKPTTMKKSILFLYLIVFISCGSNQNKKKEEVGNTPSNSAMVDTNAKADLDVSGIYEFVYPYNTQNNNENHYIALKHDGDSMEGWYYGTSDEFDQAREGYLPGYFVAKMTALAIKSDSIFFKLSTGYNKCYVRPVAVGYVTPSLILETNEIWNQNDEEYLLEYSGDLTKSEITLMVNGTTRVYKKRKNTFTLDTNNFE
jgi:hypothetical protein